LGAFRNREERAGEVQGEVLGNIFFRNGLERGNGGGTGVGEHDIDMTELRTRSPFLAFSR
jgi:hypothetical protein